MELVSSARTGWVVVVDGLTRMVAPALACSSESGIFPPLVRRSLEMTGLISGWTIMVSSSTEVASVPVASLLDDGAGLACGEAVDELAGERLAPGASKTTSPSSSFTMDAFLAFFATLSPGDGVRRSSSLLRFVGVRVGSTEGDFPSGDSSAFLNRERDRGVLFTTLGLIMTSGVSD